jgi:hypothetical protein
LPAISWEERVIFAFKIAFSFLQTLAHGYILGVLAYFVYHRHDFASCCTQRDAPRAWRGFF